MIIPLRKINVHITNRRSYLMREFKIYENSLNSIGHRRNYLTHFYLRSITQST